MRRIFNLFVLTFVVMSVSFVMQSCDDDDDEYYWGSPEWFGGKVFTAEAQPGQYNALWVLEFYNNGTFTVIPTDSDGNTMWQLESYEGRWTVDYNTGRIYISYYGYSANTVWTFTWWDEEDSYSGYYPYIEIYTAYGSGQLDNLTFYPGF